MRKPETWTVLLNWLALLALPAMSMAEGPANESITVQTLKTLYQDGIVRRVSLNRLDAVVAKAKLAKPKEPALDYGYGLVLLSRVQPAKAVEHFKAALMQNPAHLPTWRALLRTRLIRKDQETLKTESLELATLVGSEDTAWADESARNDAAAHLGQIAAFLALPEVDLMKPKEQQQFKADLETAAGNRFASAWAAGKQSLEEQYEALQQEFDEEIEQESRDQEQKAKEELAELTGRADELDQKAESLKLTAAQWKTKLEANVKKADGQLKDLEKNYNALKQSATAVERLIQETQMDAARYQTELVVQGIRGRDADQQPAMIQLRAELTRYQAQYQNLEQRGARVLLEARQILAGRARAVKEYEQATGEIVRETETLSRWKKNVEKAQGKIENRDAKTDRRSVERRLSMPASYFELDEKAELARLIEQAGGTLETP